MTMKRKGTAFLGALAATAACNKQVAFSGKSADKIEPQVVIDQSFPAALIGDTTTKFKPAFGLVDEEITLKELPAVTSTLTQISRAAVQDTFTQGHDGANADEKFPISTFGKVDIVVVVDDSASMSSYQDLLTQGFTGLLSALQNTDWQIVVTSSTASETCLRTDGTSGKTIITRADYLADPTGTQAVFNRLVTPPGTSGVSTNADQNDERVLYGASRALDYTKQVDDSYLQSSGQAQAACANINWVRPDSAIAILTITDEDNCHASSETNFHHTSVNANPPAADTTYTKPSDFADTTQNGCSADEYSGKILTDQLKDMGRTPGVNARFYAIYWHTGDAARPSGGCGGKVLGSRNSDSNQGWAYDNVIAATNGTYGDICDSSYQNTLTSISTDVASLIKRQVQLQHTPIGGTLVVTIDGQPFTNYTLSGTMLQLGTLPASATNLEVTYQHDALPKFDNVTLTQKAEAGTMAVTVAGALLDPSKYTYDETTGLLTFVDQPADDAAVVVDYRQDLPLTSDFDLSQLKIAGQPLAVTVNSQPATGVTYDPTTQRLSFTTPPPDGAAIGVTYKQPDSKVTHYPQPAQSETGAVQSMTVEDAQTKQAVPVTMEDGDFVFDEADVVDGRQIDIIYNYGDKSTVLSHELANLPLDGTVQVQVDDGTPNCIDNVAVDGTKVQFGCDASQLGEVAISYQYLAQHYTTFTIDQDVPPNAFVQVFVDGQMLTTEQWSQSGRTFTVADSLTKLNSTVRILASIQVVQK